MKINDIFAYAYGAVKLRKLRAGLTALGIVIGIAAIVALLSLSQGFSIAISNQFETGFSTNTLIVSTQGLGLQPSRSDLSLYVNDTVTINEIANVQTSVAIISKTCYITIGERVFSASVVGVDFNEYSKIYSSTFVAESGDIPLDPSNDTIILGNRISDPWQNGTLLGNIGDSLQITWTTRSGFTLVNETYTGIVVGILAEIGGFGVGGPSDRAIYIPISQAQNFFGTSEANTIIVQLANSDDATITDVSTAITDAFGGQVQVIAPTAILDTITTAFSTIELFLTGIAGISLLVAGIGIMNIMIVSLMERTREIGILKALGMKNRTVLSIFLSESLIIGVIGTLVGIASGSGLAAVFSRLGIGGGGNLQGFRVVAGGGGLSITPVMTETVLLGSLTFGIVVSVVFALYPAWRASKLKPVDALRYE